MNAPDFAAVSAAERRGRNGHAGGILWLTGLSGAGKSTLAGRVERALFDRGCQCLVLDGDTVRGGLCADLGFGLGDRSENIRRVGEMAKLLARNGLIVIVAFISPLRADRDRVRRSGGALFHEIHLATDLAVCQARDPKGLYARARRGEIPDFTGISSPYEAPPSPELVIEAGRDSVECCVGRLVAYAERAFAIGATTATEDG